tara:strand:- start:20147 stop:20881 length:735 start_codon:yes stop_codon:yes gene_type:complete
LVGTKESAVRPANILATSEITALSGGVPTGVLQPNPMAWRLKLVSGNSQTGPIPVSTSGKDTCNPKCPLIKKCYAKKLFWINNDWNKVSSGERGTDYSTFTNSIRKLPHGQLWRHNQAGDIPSPNRPDLVDQLIKANRGRRGFTYTSWDHKDKLFLRAKRAGFTINKSCYTASSAAATAARGIPAVFSGAPVEYRDVTAWTEFGVRFVVCPTKRNSPAAKKVQCATCQLCHTRPDNTVIVFPLH